MNDRCTCMSLLESTRRAVKRLSERSRLTRMKLMVREPAQSNRANKRVQTILAERYDVTINDVRLLTGHRSAKKVFVIK